MVSQRNQRPRHVDPLILIFDRCLPVRVRHNVLNRLHIGQQVLNHAVVVGDVPRGTKLLEQPPQSVIERTRRDELHRNMVV